MVLTKCQRNIAGREEDSGRHVAYTPCGKPAHWYVDERWQACEEHAIEAIREGVDEVADIIDGEPMRLDDDGELAVAP
jgi:hypothetical protein